MNYKRSFARIVLALGFSLCAASCAYTPRPPPWGSDAALAVSPGPVMMADVGRLYSAQVKEVAHVREIADLQAAVQRAGTEKLKVSISAKRHSQGGHVFYKDAVVLDMTRFNKILRLDEERKIITVQSGATWEDIQNYANDHGLAVKVQQASNIFTVGGSLSVNAHGRDPNFGPIIESVRSFRILLADGRIAQASRTENAELFSLAIGGYGLFGVILDVDLSLTDNDVYEKKTVELDYADYLDFFKKEIRGNPKVGLHYAWPSFAPEGFLKTMLVSTYYKTDQRPEGIFSLTTESFIPISRFFLSLSRQGKWGKDLRWSLQKQFADRPGSIKIVCRNNAMRPEVLFLEYGSPKDTDILQEYFVPVDRIVSYMDALRNVLQAYDVNVLSVTIRYVPQNTEAFLSYARQPSFAVVLYINQELSEQGRKTAQEWTRKLVDVTLDHGGTYYLPYQLYPTREQLLRAYPNFDKFIALKRIYDPSEMFVNLFYEHYQKNHHDQKLQ
jgi:FAD/FMN-containing dehydrogenase